MHIPNHNYSHEIVPTSYMHSFHNPSALTCHLIVKLLTVFYMLSFCIALAVTDCPIASPTIVPNKDEADLKVLVPNITSLRQFVNCSDPARVRGFCIDVFERALSIVIPSTNLSSTMSIHYTCFNFSSGPSGPTYDDMVEFVANGTYDAVVGDVTIGAQRLSKVDFTHYYMESGVVILTNVSPQQVYSPWFFFAWPFSLRMWCTIIGGFAFTGLLICFLEHPNHPEFKQGHIRNRIDNILWFIIKALVLLEKEAATSSISRAVMVAWVFFVLLVNASYTAGLSSFFTVNSLSPSSQTIISLKESNKSIGYRKGSIVKSYLTERFHIRDDQLVALRPSSDYISNLTKGPDRGGVIAIVDELPYVNLILANLSSKTCDYAISGQPLTSEGFGFGFNKERNIANTFSIAVLNLIESGCLQQLEGMDNMNASSKCSTVNSQNSEVTWRSSLALFIPLVVAFSVLLIVYYVKIYIHPQHIQPSVLTTSMDDPLEHMFPEIIQRHPPREVELHHILH